MIKRLSRHGNSLALVLDKALLDLLEISAETPLEIRTDGQALIVTPVADPARREALDEALQHVNRTHGGALKRMAE